MKTTLSSPEGCMQSPTWVPSALALPSLPRYICPYPRDLLLPKMSSGKECWQRGLAPASPASDRISQHIICATRRARFGVMALPPSYVAKSSRRNAQRNWHASPCRQEGWLSQPSDPKLPKPPLTAQEQPQAHHQLL